MIGLSLALVVVAVAVIGPFVAPHSATEFVELHVRRAVRPLLAGRPTCWAATC